MQPLVLAPYVPEHRRAETVERLTDLAAAGQLELCWWHCQNDEDYWRAVCFHWGRRFLVIEEDMVPSAEQLLELWTCPQPWCGINHLGRAGTVGPSWGQKFSPQAASAYPGLLKLKSQPPEGGWAERHWWQFGGFIERGLQAAGLEIHVHPGPLLHLGGGQGTHPAFPPRV